MKTIRSFGNVAEAGFAQSLLVSVGLGAVLADEYAYTLEGPNVPWGIRLQVPEEEAERALKILDEQEGFLALPDDFVPPETAEPETVGQVVRSKEGMSRGAAFFTGGLGLLAVGGISASVAALAGLRVQASWEWSFVFFVVGAGIGLGLRAAHLRGQDVVIGK